MACIPWGLSEPMPIIKCLECDKEYQYDPLTGWGCLYLTDDRGEPQVILGAWCDKTCFGKWLDNSEARKSLVLH